MKKNIPFANKQFYKFIEMKKLTQAKIASITGVSRSNISHIINGRINISEHFLISLMKEYNLNPEWIRYGAEPMILPNKGEGIPVVADIPAGPWKHWINLYSPGKSDEYINFPGLDC